jgi:hypothetical protein
MTNYTQPDKKNHKDKPEDWLLSALMFAKVLSYVLPKGKGIIIDLDKDMIKLLPRPDIKRVIVHNTGNATMITITDEHPNIKDGSWIDMIDTNIISN